jgi:DNA-binding transcriptional MocR family regulator
MLMAEVGRGTFIAPKRSYAPLFSPIEIDSAIHNEEAQTYQVNLFSPHLPNVGQARLIRQLLSEIAHNPPSGIMHYPSRQTSRAARDAAVKWLRNAPLGPFDRSSLTLTNGGQNAIVLVMQAVLKGRKPTILVEELAYPGFRRAAELLRVNVVPIAMDEDGIIPEALAAACGAYEAQILCTSPEVHNPTGGFTPEHRREEIVKVARKHDLQILEDDCYRMGAAEAPTYRMLAPERGWYVSSISKTVTPALRIGIAVAPEGKGARLRRAAEHSFFGLATPITDLAARLLVHPQLDALTTKARMGTNAYVESAVNILGSYDLTWRKDVPFLWLKLPEGWRAGAFCQAAEAVGVQIRPAEEFACRDARVPHAIRFAINAGVSLESFEAAIGRLRDLLDNPQEQIGV